MPENHLTHRGDCASQWLYGKHCEPCALREEPKAMAGKAKKVDWLFMKRICLRRRQDQVAAQSQDTVSLTQHDLGLGHVLQHLGREHAIKRAVPEGQPESAAEHIRG